MPTGDVYDPEFGSMANAQMVRDCLGDLLDKIHGYIVPLPKATMLTVCNPVFPDGQKVVMQFSSRELRILQFAIERAMASIGGLDR